MGISDAIFCLSEIEQDLQSCLSNETYNTYCNIIHSNINKIRSSLKYTSTLPKK